MNLPDRWPLLAAIAVGIGVAVAAGPDLAIAIPFAGAAIALTAVYLLDAALSARAATERLAFVPPPNEPDRIAAAFASGPYGRRAIVALLDRLDRERGTARGPSSTEGSDAVVSLSRAEFESYVRRRVETLEADA